MLFMVSIAAFVIINLPPGDFLDAYIARMASSGTEIELERIDAMRAQYGLDKPIYVQYFIWFSGLFVGDFGWSFAYGVPVSELVGERLALTVAISICTLLFTYAIAVPVGIYSATHQYSPLDYVVTFAGFIGLATPNFLLALVLMFFGWQWLGVDVGGLFSTEYMDAPWSIAKFVDMLKHLWIPVIVIGTAGTAGIIRVMRACLLDELRKPYVQTALSKGLHKREAVYKYPVRISLNPIISTIGWMLPQIVSGSAITAVVLSLPTTGSLLLGALRLQDMYLAGSMILLLSVLTIIGTIVSDILLAVSDPRIRFS
jgi:peptide/nickel transport system permease protein